MTVQEDIYLTLGDPHIGDAITSFPAAYEFCRRNRVKLWISNPQVRALWNGPDVEWLPADPGKGLHLNILRPHNSFVMSGLHMIQAWFENFGLPVPMTWDRPALNFNPNASLEETVDVLISPFSHSDGAGLKSISFERWRRVISALRGAGLIVAVAGQFSDGPDQRFWESGSVIELDGLRLPDVCRWISAARCVVTIDNGLGHLAHLIGAQHVHMIPKHPNMAPASWVANRNSNAVIVYDALVNINFETILARIFEILGRFNRSIYLSINKDLTRNNDIMVKRMAAWNHAIKYAEREKRRINIEENFEIPGFYDDLILEGDFLDQKSVLENFVSIGDNCEFGLVQRHYGAEPLDLLRWFATPIDKLIHLLERKFENFSSENNLEIIQEIDEYVAHEKYYGLIGHTFIDPKTIPKNDFFIEFRSRMIFLKNKLIEDLESADRIFVYKANSGVTDDDAIKLFLAIRQYGNGNLLVLRVPNENRRVGTVEEFIRGLYIGYVESFAPYEEATNISPASWFAVARRTIKMISMRQ